MGGFYIYTQLKESLLRTSPGGNHIGAVLLDRSRIEALAELGPGAQFFNQMEVNNSAMLTPKAHSCFKRLMPLPAWQGDDGKQPFQADFLEAQLIESLNSCCNSSLRPALKTY